MTEREADLEQVEMAARQLIPELAARLAKHGLGELEIRRGALRVRVAGSPSATRAPARAEEPAAAVAAAVSALPAQEPGGAAAAAGIAATAPSPAAERTAPHHGVTSPAVGFFVYAEGLGPGLTVEKGDSIGWVEMLGVRHDVRAPRSGVVSNLVTESGEPVEYAQLLIELEPAG
jgi:acetyl-CoA carboxylase biotin carboxyl carrier protein